MQWVGLFGGSWFWGSRCWVGRKPGGVLREEKGYPVASYTPWVCCCLYGRHGNQGAAKAGHPTLLRRGNPLPLPASAHPQHLRVGDLRGLLPGLPSPLLPFPPVLSMQPGVAVGGGPKPTPSAALQPHCMGLSPASIHPCGLGPGLQPLEGTDWTWLHRDFTPQPQAPAPSPGSTGEVALDGGHEERQAGASCFCGPHISSLSPTYLPFPGPAPEPGGPALLATVLKLCR